MLAHAGCIGADIRVCTHVMCFVCVSAAAPETLSVKYASWAPLHSVQNCTCCAHCPNVETTHTYPGRSCQTYGALSQNTFNPVQCSSPLSISLHKHTHIRTSPCPLFQKHSTVVALSSQLDDCCAPSAQTAICWIQTHRCLHKLKKSCVGTGRHGGS